MPVHRMRLSIILASVELLGRGENREIPAARAYPRPIRRVEGHDGYSGGGEFMCDAAPPRRIAAADQCERQRLKARIMTDEHEVMIGIWRTANDCQQRRDCGVIEFIEKPRLGLGFQVPEGETERLPRSPRGRAQHEIGDQATLREESAHQRRRLLAAPRQRAVEILEAGVGPARLGVAEEGQGAHGTAFWRGRGQLRP
jgi:hypothetical protein